MDGARLEEMEVRRTVNGLKERCLLSSLAVIGLEWFPWR